MKRLTVFDILVLIAIVIVCIVGIMFLQSKKIEPNRQIFYTIEVRNTLLDFDGLVVGDAVCDSVRGLPAGRVHEVDVRPAMIWVYDPTINEYIQSFSDSTYDVYVTFKAYAQVDDFIKLEGFRPQVGYRTSVEGKGFSVAGIIVGVRLGEAR